MLILAPDGWAPATTPATREQQGGKKNLKFSHRIVAKRKDIKGERLKKIQLSSSIPTHPEMPKRVDLKTDRN